MTNPWNEYHKDRLRSRRLRLVAILGGQCVHCGRTDGLQFDHIDPTTKAFNISKRLGTNWDVLFAEVAKCQLLCSPCHHEKSRSDGSTHRPGKLPPDQWKHGTFNTRYTRHCHCADCMAFARTQERCPATTGRIRPVL